MAFAEDLAPFFSPDEFAVSATIGAATVQVIFDNGYQAVLAGLMESQVPTCVGATADLAAAVEGTAVTIESVAYKVVDNQPDGTGVTTLVLEKAA